ncbi:MULTISPECIES: ECF transporter S component [unclassified Microbacterium]|uniref:ECF transporter S component n=1 Tax=unclassified Microbacterium TaxID=2609290 RepID=UPI00214AA14F|nr:MULTISPECIES: ECF transporter S component [unclassified Microbacterium]MCR2783883.1 ECF transporter S component [Microbacterium sp. zg.B96]MDL5351325.1 ECF transporter S component [Microbacterium sp. zg-YB36]WIM15271.1 ECF transporter S component [Microbacterium sp. zg-B96]
MFSTTTTKNVDPNRLRNTILVAVGSLVIVATYLYLVVGQPTEVAESSTSQASLIAIGGYVIGAILLAAGSIHRLPTATIAMIPVAIALNIVVGQIVAVLGLPVYIDSIGTVLVAALAGPAAGVVTGILTNVIWGLTLSPIALPFAVVQVIIGVMAGYAARMGMFRRFYLAPVAGFVTGIVAAVISAPISAFVFGGATGGGTGAIVGAFQAMGQSILGATTLQGLLSDPLDKAITFTIVVLILAALPNRFRQRFPFVRQYRVFGKAAPTVTSKSESAS